MNIEVGSPGCNAPWSFDACGIAYIYVNRRSWLIGTRGHNVVIVDGATGNLSFRVQHQVKNVDIVFT